MFRRARLIILFAIIFLITLRYYTQRRSILDITEGKTSGPWREEWSSPLSKKTKNSSSSPDEYLTYLRTLRQKHNLPHSIQFYPRRLKSQPNSPSTPRPNLTHLKKIPFFPSSTSFTPLTLSSSSPSSNNNLPPLPPPLSLPIPNPILPSKINASPLLFATTSTYTRLTSDNSSLLHSFASFLTDGQGSSNGAGFLLSLHGASEAEVSTVQEQLHTLGVDASVFASREGQTDRGGRWAWLMQGLMRVRFSVEGRERKWFLLMDDDIFFPGVGKLLERLGGFDVSEPWYIGVPGREGWVVKKGGGKGGRDGKEHITYGGGVVALTAPMLDTTGQLLCLQYTTTGGQQGKLDEGKMKWDESLWGCLYGNLGEGGKLNVLGGYEPGSQEAGEGELPLVMRAGKEREWEGQKVSVACGEECFLQRFLFKDGWVLVNGLEVVKWEGGVKVEKGKRKNEGVRYAEGLKIVEDKGKKAETRYLLQGKGKMKTWRLADSLVRENGEVWQAYVHRKGSDGGDDHEKSDGDSVIVLVWEP